MKSTVEKINNDFYLFRRVVDKCREVVRVCGILKKGSRTTFEASNFFPSIVVLLGIAEAHSRVTKVHRRIVLSTSWSCRGSI
jgi:hypothetical protein